MKYSMGIFIKITIVYHSDSFPNFDISNLTLSIPSSKTEFIVMDLVHIANNKRCLIYFQKAHNWTHIRIIALFTILVVSKGVRAKCKANVFYSSAGHNDCCWNMSFRYLIHTFVSLTCRLYFVISFIIQTCLKQLSISDACQINLSSVFPTLNQFSHLTFMQSVIYGWVCFQLVHISPQWWVWDFIIIISEIWPFTQRLGFDIETMVCFAMFLDIHGLGSQNTYFSTHSSSCQ